LKFSQFNVDSKAAMAKQDKNNFSYTIYIIVFCQDNMDLVPAQRRKIRDGFLNQLTQNKFA
jgi:hypothetical protein